MRLIDADYVQCKAANTFNVSRATLGEEAILLRFQSLIEYAPTEQVEQVKHGRWIDKGLDIECSICGFEYSDELPYMCKRSTPGTGGMEGFEYCPHCGARMDGGETHDQV